MATKTITRLASFKGGYQVKSSNELKKGDYVSSRLGEVVGIVTDIQKDRLTIVVVYSNSKRLNNGRYLKGHIKWFNHVEEVLLRTEKVKTNGN